MARMPIQVAIDPGKTGAIVWSDRGGRVEAANMPPTPRDIFWHLRKIKTGADSEKRAVEVLIEKVGLYFPGPGAEKRMGSNLKLREHFGELRGFCIALGLPFDDVTPRTWQSKVVPGLPKGQSDGAKKARKHKIRSKMQELYPGVKVTLKNADALAILTFALRG